jgi:hypothetical protein
MCTLLTTRDGNNEENMEDLVYLEEVYGLQETSFDARSSFISTVTKYKFVETTPTLLGEISLIANIEDAPTFSSNAYLEYFINNPEETLFPIGMINLFNLDDEALLELGRVIKREVDPTMNADQMMALDAIILL